MISSKAGPIYISLKEEKVKQLAKILEETMGLSESVKKAGGPHEAILLEGVELAALRGVKAVLNALECACCGVKTCV